MAADLILEEMGENLVAAVSLLLPVTATFASGATVCRQLLTCGKVFAIQRGRLMVNLSTVKPI